MAKHSSFIIGISLWACLLLLIGGCTTSDNKSSQPVIASTEFAEIPLDTFIKSYKNFLSFTGVEDNLLFRSGMLKSELDRLYLLKHAESTGFNQRPAVVHQVELAQGQVLLNEFYFRELKTNVTVPDIRIREAFRRSKIDIHARHLYAPSLEEATMLKKRLDEGESWESLAKSVFKDPYLSENGGDLGFFSYNDMDPAFEDAAYRLKDGEISGPVKTSRGYSIIQVIEREYNPIITEFDYQVHKEDFEVIELRRMLKDTLRSFTQLMFKELNPVIDAESLEWLLANFNDIVNGNNYDLSETQNISITFSADRWDFPRIQDELTRTTPNQRKQVQTTDDLFKLLAGLGVRNAILQWVKESDWINSAEVKAKLDSVKNQRILKLLVEDIYARNNIPDDQEKRRQAYFSFIEEIKTGSKTSIDEELLKSFTL